MTKLLSATLPFSGFYESSHMAEIESVISYYFDTKGDGKDHVPQDFHFSFCGYRPIMEDYAAQYAKEFGVLLEDETGIKSKLVFESLQSPKEYNFTTDKIFIKASLPFFKQLRAFVSDEALAKTIEQHFTSRSGFISFYSDDVDMWKAKPLEDWDHNELGTLIEAALVEAGADDDYTHIIIEGMSCSGRIEDVVYPYVSAWAEKHPQPPEQAKAFLDITEEMWEGMTEVEQERALSALPVRCDKTPDLFDKGFS